MSKIYSKPVELEEDAPHRELVDGLTHITLTGELQPTELFGPMGAGDREPLQGCVDSNWGN